MVSDAYFGLFYFIWFILFYFDFGLAIYEYGLGECKFTVFKVTNFNFATL